jgi:flagellar biosynthetic protein FliP
MKSCAKHMAFLLAALILLLGFIGVETCLGQESSEGTYLKIGMDGIESNGRTSVVLQIFFLLTVLSIAPALLILLTSFTRIAIVLSLLRQALGTHQMPPNQIIIGLALFLTFFIMTPVWNQVNKEALQPYLDEKITQKEALNKAVGPIRNFMFKQTREKDLGLLIDIAKLERPKDKDDVATTVLIPAFVISEMKTAFQIGFLLYVPFLVIDMVVSSVLLSMGMMMLPPIMVSLPFKLMIFVLADGWNLIVGSLVKSFIS